MGKMHVKLSQLLDRYSNQLKISFFANRSKLKYSTVIAIIRDKREFKEDVGARLRQELYQFWLGLGKDFGFFERWQQETPTGKE